MNQNVTTQRVDAGKRWDPRLGVNALSSRHWTLRQDLDFYERLGIERISVSVTKLVDAGLDRAVAEIVGSGIQVDGILPGARFDLCDEGTWSVAQDAMMMALDVAQRLGASTVHTTGGSARGQTFDWAADKFRRAVGPVIAVATKGDIRVALEPVPSQFAGVGFVHTLRDALTLARESGIWLVADLANFWREADMAGLLATGAPLFDLVQVSDLPFEADVFERLVPGDGVVPIASMLAATLGGGFEGPIELEIIGSAIEAEGYESAIERSLSYMTALL